MVQEGQEPERRKSALEQGLRAIGQRAFGQDPSGVEIRWTRIARGFGFTGGEPSTSSLVVGSVPVGLAPGPREAFMREVSAMWSRETGCALDEIVVTAWDGPLPI
jgi:hypothetical protein